MNERLAAWWVSRRSRRVEIDGISLQVPAGVLDPVRFRVGSWFAREVEAALPRRGPAPRLLDLGCGTGVVGCFAERAGAQVTATDIDARACAAARSNGLRDVRRGDLFEPVEGERFDWICFNPPYFPRRGPGGPLDRALYGGPGLGLLRRFAEQVADRLTPGGRAWVALSERAPGAAAALGPGWTAAVHGLVEGEALSVWTSFDPCARSGSE